MPPRAELRYPQQVKTWIEALAHRIKDPATIILIGSGGLLLHAALRGIDTELPSYSMDIDPIVDTDELAMILYDAAIGSDFEKEHGWHVNLMPHFALKNIPAGWERRSERCRFGPLLVVVPAVEDLLAPKMERGEPRDFEHARWAKEIGLIDVDLTAGKKPTSLNASVFE
jgi:hypothetical protein